MSQENVEIVTRIYAELNSHQAFPSELFAPDCVTDLTEVSLEHVTVLHGVHASQKALAPYFGTFDDFHVAAEVLHADEHRVVTAIRDGGRIKGSGAEVWSRYFHAWTLRDGMVVRLSSHTDREEAFKAVGLEGQARSRRGHGAASGLPSSRL
jgi:ketosteroid isomerase-like protein